MVASVAASPLCKWLVAASTSLSWENDLKMNPFQYSRRLSKRLKRKVLSKCCGDTSNARSPISGLISSFRGSSVPGILSSCSVFEPRSDYYKCNGLSSLFGSRYISINRKQKRTNQARYSGETMAVALQPVQEVSKEKKPIMKQRRVVVTGMGVVTPLGNDPDIFYNNLLDGVSGISEIEAFDCAQFPTRIAGEIKSFSTDGWVDPKLSKRMDKFMLYMLTAGKKALAHGGMTDDAVKNLDKAKCGVLIGSAMGGAKMFNDAVEALRISYKKMNPFCIPFSATSMGSAMLAIDLGWMGPNYSISADSATSNYCILNAANHIIRGEADVMLCGGSDAAIIPIALGGFLACRALSQRNGDPATASRPWDINRDGFVMGEGAGVLLLEELDHAKRRGARICAEFLGGSFTTDAYHVTEPHPDGVGVTLCIEKALAQAGVAREDVNYINAHATSTPAGDLKEYKALAHCFRKNSELKVNSSKSMIGHLFGAAGAVEAVAVVQAIRTGWVHPNVNLENPDEGLDPSMLVGRKKERLDIKVALSNSYGFGGHNSSILFAPYK